MLCLPKLTNQTSLGSAAGEIGDATMAEVDGSGAGDEDDDTVPGAGTDCLYFFLLRSSC